MLGFVDAVPSDALQPEDRRSNSLRIVKTHFGVVQNVPKDLRRCPSPTLSHLVSDPWTRRSGSLFSAQSKSIAAVDVDVRSLKRNTEPSRPFALKPKTSTRKRAVCSDPSIWTSTERISTIA